MDAPQPLEDEGENYGVAQEPASTPAQSEIEEYEFPVLAMMLSTYFATGKDLLFLERYERFGESSAEFAGLADDLRAAIRHPQRATREVNAILGTDLDVPTMRGQLAELLDQITGAGQFSEEAQAEAEAEAEEKRATPDEMLDYYAARRVSLPAFTGSLSRFEFPLWSVLAAGFVSIALGLGIGNLPLPDFLGWIPGMFSIVGLVIIGFTAMAMLGLRSEIRNPDREEKRRAAREEDAAKRAEKRERRARFWL